MTPISILEGARERLKSPEKWTKNFNARDEHGYPCHYNSGYARSWCVVGAVASVGSRDEVEGAYELLREARVRLWPGGAFLISLWNDAPERTHADVLRLFDEAIAYGATVPWASRPA